MFLSYARVSTRDQDDDDRVSISVQLRRNRAVVDLKEGAYGDISEYTDRGISGSTPFTKRPEGGRLWNEMQPGDIVIAAKLDRMFRSAADALIMLERFRERMVKLILVDIGVEPIGDTPTSEAFFGFISVIANLERKMINERTSMGRAGKQARNGHIGGEAPYGWSKVGAGRNAMLVPEPREQEAVALIMRRWHNFSVVEIIDELNEAGYRMRDGREWPRTGGNGCVRIKRIYDREMRRAKWENKEQAA